MATQTAPNVPVGNILTMTAPVQTDSNNQPLPTQNPDYTAPVMTFDDTFWSRVNGPPFALKAIGPVGATAITFTSTSSNPGDTSPITDVISVTVVGPVAAGLQTSFTVAPPAS
jgi:hypothetical protein